MDPNANLREQLELARLIADGKDGEFALAGGAERLAELVLDLDEWIIKQGFLPKRWSRP